MKIKNLFKQVETANFVNSKTFAQIRVCVSCDVIDHELNDCEQTFMNEAYCGPARTTFDTWDEFEYTLKEGYTENFVEAVMNTPLKEDKEKKQFILDTKEFTMIFAFWHK